jgi:hypothetical protein
VADGGRHLGLAPGLLRGRGRIRHPADLHSRRARTDRAAALLLGDLLELFLEAVPYAGLYLTPINPMYGIGVGAGFRFWF